MNFILRRKILICMLFIGLSLMGYFSYSHLKMELFPMAEQPILMVNIGSKVEVDPKYMESMGAIPVEGVISSLEGVDKIETNINQRSARISISFNQNTDIKYAYLKLEEKLNGIKKNLPEEFSVNLFKGGMGQVTNQFMSIEIRGSGGTNRVRSITDRDILPKLQNIDGIANVDIFGGQEKSLDITLNSKLCEALNITPSTVGQIISAGQKDKEFAGSVYKDSKRYFVNISSEYKSVKDLQNIVIKAEGPILLKDIADIDFGVKKPDSYSRVNGKDIITAVMTKSTQVNLIDISNKTKKVIDELNEELAPKDVKLVVQNNTADTMEENVNQIINLAVTGALLAIFILWLFLRNFSMVTVIAVAIPASVYSAFNFFYYGDISINSLTLVGIAMAIGMLLDNSVVVMENIYRLSSKGLPPDKASTQGTKEVWKSVIAATLTTITVFLPFVFSSQPMIKLIGSHVGISIISTLIISLFVALLLIPMATHHFLKKSEKKNFINLKPFPYHNRLIQIYSTMLKLCLRNPAVTIIGALVLFFVTIFGALAINVNSLKEAKTNEFNIYVKMNPGSSLDQTDKAVRDYVSYIDDLKEKEDVICKVYEGEAQITVKLKEDFEESKDRKLTDIERDLSKNFYRIPMANLSMEASASNEKFRAAGSMNQAGQLLSLLGVGKQSERIVIKGHDFAKMDKLAEDIQYFVEELEEVSNASKNYSGSSPEAQIEFDQKVMGLYGITPSQVMSELNSFSSETETNSVFKDGNDEYNITIKTDELKKDEQADEKTLEELKDIIVYDKSQAAHRLRSFSKVVLTYGKPSINRLNQEKHIEIKYFLQNDINKDKDLLEDARLKIEEVVANVKIPAGIAVEIIHEEDMYGDFKFMILAAFILIFMILASVFESVITPFVLMFSIPLAAIGSLLGLIFTGNSLLNANTLTGFLILLGVVVNNGIILIDYTKILRKRGYNRNRAIIAAGVARIRPILITAITTIIAMLPLALGEMEYVSAIGAPFAITVIGGLAVSTLLTLIFIPTLYTAMEDSIQWFKELKPWLQIMQAVLLTISCFFIFTKVDAVTFQLLYLFAALIIIPGTVWFLLNSLRKADKDIVAEDEEISISVRNLVKIYGREKRFTREWKSGQKIRERLNLAKTYTSKKDFNEMIWQVPLLGFLVYLAYFHIESNFWITLISFFVWRLTCFILKAVNIYVNHNYQQKRWLVFISKNIYRCMYWGLPLITGVYLWKLNSNIATGIFIVVLYYLGILVNNTSKKIIKENVHIDGIQGRFGGLKRMFFKFVSVIPFIGKRTVPFKANKGISLEIHTGMFGLLGPNGAGKTTLMRNICGIFEQSYGKIFINGIDTQKKREELQGLIGYLPQEFGTYENLTSWEFLDYQALLKGIKNEELRNERVTHVLKAVHMYENKDKKIGGFSGGMKQRIGIAQTLLHLPRILVVDEPTAGLDPRERIRFRNLLVELSKNRIVIFSTHIIEDIASSCNQVAVIDKGELKYFGTPSEMTNIAKEYVWQFDVTPEEFEQLPNDILVVLHMNKEDKIRVRCLSMNKPHEEAINVNPILEDSYLWLLKMKGQKHTKLS